MAEVFFKWQERYELKIKSVDNDHKVIVDYMNVLHEKFENKAPAGEQKKAYANLLDFTVKHFSEEEKYFDSLNFPGASTHKIIHKQLLQKLTDFGIEFDKNHKFQPELFVFLKTWLTAHILGIDTKYADFAKQKAA